jgi:hypothetical protein
LRRSWTSWLSASLVLVALALPAPAAAVQATTRVFAMQPKLDLAWLQSRATFHDKMFGLADRTLRDAGKPLIQTGAGDFASHLRADGRNLVVWPEDIGLWAAFTGQRGTAARASGSLPGAIAGLYSAYAPQASWYGARYPAVAARAPQIRLLALALTDTFARTAVETFSEMASKYHVWLEAGADIAQRWHVVCKTDEHPPQEPCDEQNPAKVQALGDPEEPGRGYAYEATSPDVSNIALLFGPDGKLVSKQVKAYITPIEVGRAEGQVAALDLVPGSITSGLTAVTTPVGTLGFVTSKDAWMPDVLDRLEAAHVDLLVQPEFFAGDLAVPTGMWSADTLKASGYSDLLRHPGFTAMALPSAVGNVFDFSADQQTHIAVRPQSPGGGRWLIGQPPGPGLVGVTPWVVKDPVRKGEPTGERRKRLGEAGRKLAPGSGVKCPDQAKPGVCENGHVEAVLWRDVPVGPRAYERFAGTRVRRAPFSHARALHRTPEAQRNAAIAASGRNVVIAFEEHAAGHDHVWVSTSTDAGRRWSSPREVDPADPGDQRWPAVAAGPAGDLTVAWTQVSGGASRVVFMRGRTTFGEPAPLDPAVPGDSVQWKPALAPGAGGVVHAAFVDARARSNDGALPQAGIFYTQIGADGAAAPAKRMDVGPPDALAAKLDNAWAPRIAVSGDNVLLTWIDFMHYDWDVLSRLSSDGGRTFAPQVDSNLEKPDVENLSDSPQPLFVRGAPLIAWTDFQKRDSIAAAHQLYDTYLAAPGKAPVQADPYGARQVSTFWPSVCADRGDALVAFQDSATGVGRIRVTRMTRGTRRGSAPAVNDTAANAYRPALACTRGRAIVAWEDDRNGPGQIFVASAQARSLDSVPRVPANARRARPTSK